MKHLTCLISFILLFVALPLLGQGTTYVTMKVGEEKVLYFPSSVTSKNLKAGSLVCYSNATNYVTVSYYTDYCVCVKAIKAYSSPVVIHCTYYYFLSTNQLASGYYDYYITISTIKPTKITLPASISLEEGTMATLTPTVIPNNAEYTLTWTTNNPYVAVVDNGKVRADRPGTATITAKTDNNLSAACKVTVTERKRIEMKSSITLYTGDSYTLTPTVYPSNAQYTLTWSSSDNNVAKVEDGKVTAINPGTATITVRTDNNLSASCKVTVKEKKPTQIEMNSSITIAKGESHTLNPTVIPSDARYALTWSSSDETVAEVNNGIVTGINPGTCNIIVETDNGLKASCEVTVLRNFSDGEYFTSLTEEGLEMRFCVISAKERTCQVCYIEYEMSQTIEGDVTIPSNPEGMKVVKISDYAFQNCKITKISIPNSVTSIGSYAFSGCSELNTLVIPNSVTTIGKNAFNETLWYNLQPDGVVYVGKVAYTYKGIMPENANVEIEDGTLGIADRAFEYCTKMVSVTIPNSVTTIGEGAFINCWKITSVYIPSSVTSVGKSTFAHCNNLSIINVSPDNGFFDSRGNSNAIIETKTNKLIVGCKTTIIPNTVSTLGASCFHACMGLRTFSIPNSVKIIEESAFFACNYLTSINLPNSITSIGTYAFAGTRLTSLIIPNSVQKLGMRAFDGCGSLKTISLSTSLTEIPYEAFNECVHLTSLTIPDGVRKIGQGAFSKCNDLISVVIPSSVERIGSKAFESCYNIEDVWIKDLSAWCKIEFGGRMANPLYYAHHLYVNEELVEDLVIPDGVTSIGRDAFSYFKGIKTATIGNSVTNIEKDAFWECTGLKSVSIGENVEDIAEYAFYRCYNLTKVISHIKDPFEILNVFGDMNYEPRVNFFSSSTLYVPYGEKSKYEATEGWKEFQHIVEMDIPPVGDGEAIDFGKEINGETDLDGQVVDNIYYSIGSEEGGYNSNEGCIEVSKLTEDAAMDDIGEENLFDGVFNNLFTGIVFKVPSGTGDINITAKTTGNMAMKVKIGDMEAVSMQIGDKSRVSIPYTLTEDAFVYLYGGAVRSQAKVTKKAESANGVLKIYSIEVTHDADGIKLHPLERNANNTIYTTNGCQISKPQSGVNIIRMGNGATRKVMMK